MRAGKPADEGGPKQVDIAVPAFGYKNHAAIDRHHGFIRGWSVTDAAEAVVRNPGETHNSHTVFVTVHRPHKNLKQHLIPGLQFASKCAGPA